MRASLVDLLPRAVREGRGVPCFNVFGFEDALAVVRAAESRGAPVILATNREMVDFAGTARLAAELGRLADEAETPVCVHLDHCDELDRVRRAVDDGYTSVMYDGSQRPLEENVAGCREAVEYAHRHGVSVEGEIGSVPYSEGRAHVRDELTDPDEAGRFAAESGVDAVAVAVGNVHRLRECGSSIDFERLARIRTRVPQPLVIHGASGISADDRRRLAREGVAKFNIGTSLRQSFGRALRASLAADPEQFDRLTLFAPVIEAMRETAAEHLDVLGAGERAAREGDERASGERTRVAALAPSSNGSGIRPGASDTDSQPSTGVPDR